jgi:hypothetical protein
LVRKESKAKKSSVKVIGKDSEEWKFKVKTEFCRFWLNDEVCENQEKE